MKFQLAIIGGGPAGYTAAEAAGKAGLSVLLIEKNNLGGVCLNEGCIPTKTLLYSAKTYDGARHASKYAVNVSEVSFDLAKIIARKSKVVRKLVLGVKSKLTSNNVTIVAGEAQIIDKNTVQLCSYIRRHLIFQCFPIICKSLPGLSLFHPDITHQLISAGFLFSAELTVSYLFCKPLQFALLTCTDDLGAQFCKLIGIPQPLPCSCKSFPVHLMFL